MLRPFRIISSLSLLSVILVACQSRPASPTVDINGAFTQAFQTAMASLITATPLPTETPLPTATMPPRTPPALPAIYTTGILNPLDTPHTYISEPCQYLQNKWNPNKAKPGTVVIAIMFHGINKDPASLDPNDISVQDFKKLMNSLKELRFEAINATQLADFMEHNAYIPARAVLLVVDDRKFEEYFNDHFRPFYNKFGWPVVNGWISFLGGDDPVLLENVTLAAEGWIDYQAHGVIHNINIVPGSTDEFILSELQGSIDNIQTYYGKTPIAYIWPGGGFTPRGAQVAREVGYRLGFTVNPRGPFMYNWVPLADVKDPQRPYYIPEGPVNDPLLTLPRYWPTTVLAQLDTIRVMGNDAEAYAEANKAIELEYYDIVCSPTYGSIQTGP
ncbi:MAG: polysaccharide deacetylase family protein [Anaerolineae bacterium]|nr:polysaccharide deacetylase family protein [Anaerolineae bacterium]MDK1081092.1 polysaccharide deacetylase family protein [Anaerolineae bacterium]MDK1118372.1 polysaccharide deacetylase family protein [Anaerolineae bacterium]